MVLCKIFIFVSVMALNVQTLKVRSLTAAIFVVVLVGAVYINYYTFLSLFFLVSLWGLKEFYDLSEKMGASPFKGIGMLSGVLVFFSILSNSLKIKGIHFNTTAIWMLVPFILAIQFLFSRTEKPFPAFVYTVAGIIYCILPFALLVQIPVDTGSGSSLSELSASYNYFKVLGIIFLIWANDTFAYLGGSLIGKNKMYERVSPGKTWEGTAVGVICAVGVGFLLNLDHTFSSQTIWPLIGLFVGVFGTIGDLIESLMKRQAGVKDSGTLMPGHGGILDRFDSLMFVSPFVYFIIEFLVKA